MPPLPGSAAYYKLPVAQRAAEYQRVRRDMASRGEGEVPMGEYMTPMEQKYLHGVDFSRLKGWQSETMKKFPLQSAYLKIPEIAALLHTAQNEKWLPSITQQKLEETIWWTSHSPAQRSWFLLNATDPGSAMRSVQEQMGTILHQASGLGIHLNAAQAMELAVQAQSLGWNEQELLNATLKNAGARPTTGQLGATRHDLKGLAEEYGLPMGDGALDDWTTKVTAGTESLESFKNHMSRQARSRFQDPGVHAALDQGQTVKDYWQPYAALAGQTLGLNENELDLNNTKWRKPLDFRDDKGHRRSMTLDEWEREIKTNSTYGYDSSKNGIAEASQLVTQLRTAFGVQ